MRYFLDTEFIEKGPHLPIRLISIGIVAEDGREFYRENLGVDLSMADTWVKEHVVPHLKGPALPADVIARQLQEFIPPKPEVGSRKLRAWDEPEFWAYFGDYDWVVFCQLFGTMMDLPEGYPMFCMDLMQLSKHLGIPRDAFPKQKGTVHNALDDARWNKELYEFLMKNK